jgi:predicted N-acetyltransferase YhbS
LITREKWRKQGAGGILLDWGLSQAAKDGAPAFLEAAQSAKPLYEKHGFKHIKDSVCNGKKFGMDRDIVLAVMRKDP